MTFDKVFDMRPEKAVIEATEGARILLIYYTSQNLYQ